MSWPGSDLVDEVKVSGTVIWTPLRRAGGQQKNEEIDAKSHLHDDNINITATMAAIYVGAPVEGRHLRTNRQGEEIQWLL